MALGQAAIEHRSTRIGRWLRERRWRLALGIALVEGVLVVFDVIPGWTALAVGAIVVGFYLLVARRLRFDTPRQTSWIAAMSQVFMALVPVLAFLVTALAVIALAAIALVALVLLLADRR